MQRTAFIAFQTSTLGLAGLGLASIVHAAEIGAHAIQNFGTCASNLSHTLGDAAGFRDHRPGDLVANFFFADDNVWQQDWTTADFSSSGDTANGFAGADSSMLTYLSSHGDSSGGVFYGSLSEAQGCSFGNNSMQLGDARNRYLFLSTCYGLMLGTGKYLPEHPDHSAEDLQQVWSKGLAGTRCIYSYGTVSVDNPNYGKFFWERWKQSGVTNANAFLDASWAISIRQQPVVMCFGRDNQDANAKLDETVFSYDASAYGYSAWTWYDPVNVRTMPNPSQRAAAVPRRIVFSRSTGPDQSTALPAANLRGTWKISSVALERSPAGLTQENLVTTSKGWRYSKPGYGSAVLRTRTARQTDQDAIRLARQSLTNLRLKAPDENLTVAYVRQQKTASTDQPEPIVVNRMVAFQQAVIGGYGMLGEDGKLFVSVDATGDVRMIEDTRVKAVATAELPRDVGAAVSMDDAAEALLAMAQKRWPQSQIQTAPIEIGYVADGKNTARLMARMSFTATQGDFAKADEVSVSLQ
ncbi:MAG TPA: DUF6345 domain-containing protein [Oligoflexus sp.]|uniref:DUF6345 domain-containing protein n=1 Tax=Oligoflexus sp. TaxID=1971216 RepID=UPI002D65C7BD|nr:DUF6345 domain-containing protein [Oligoflexus sp.]HYX33473.1 DUF6345 domain-containing protein [Oligoflexus sp.]